MATVAKHIEIARTEGPEAGLAFYLEQPSSARHPQYAEITKRRTPKTQLAAYCSLYGDKIGDSTVSTTEADGGLSDADKREIAAMIVGALTGNATVVEDEDDEPETQTVPAEVVKRGKQGSRVRKPAVNYITREQAWLIAGADPQFKPRTNGDAPANNGQLYRLNMLGKLVLAE